MAEADAHPITVAIERRIDPAREVEATIWMQAGTDLATRFEGFLGSGWVRAGEGSDLWYMLYRFRDIPTLEAWERVASARLVARIRARVRRARCASSGAPGSRGGSMLRSPRTWNRGAAIRRRAATEPIQQPIPCATAAWKQAVTIWLGFFPMNLLASWVLGFVPGFADWPLVLGCCWRRCADAGHDLPRAAVGDADAAPLAAATALNRRPPWQRNRSRARNRIRRAPASDWCARPLRPPSLSVWSRGSTLIVPQTPSAPHVMPASAS